MIIRGRLELQNIEMLSKCNVHSFLIFLSCDISMSDNVCWSVVWSDGVNEFPEV